MPAPRHCSPTSSGRYSRPLFLRMSHLTLLGNTAYLLRRARQLIHVTLNHVWSQTYDRDLSWAGRATRLRSMRTCVAGRPTSQRSMTRNTKLRSPPIPRQSGWIRTTRSRSPTDRPRSLLMPARRRDRMLVRVPQGAVGCAEGDCAGA